MPAGGNVDHSRGTGGLSIQFCRRPMDRLNPMQLDVRQEGYFRHEIQTWTLTGEAPRNEGMSFSF